MRADLEIDSWLGKSLGAMHYYGMLDVEGDQPYRINRILSKREAFILNKQEKQSYRVLGCNDTVAGGYQEGEESERFDLVDDIIAEIPHFIFRNKINVSEVYYKDELIWKLICKVETQ